MDKEFSILMEALRDDYYYEVYGYDSDAVYVDETANIQDLQSDVDEICAVYRGLQGLRAKVYETYEGLAVVLDYKY